MAQPRLKFSSTHRILKRGDFLRVQDGGKRWGSPCFVVFAKARPDPVSRLGVTVSRKVDKRAVVRNRVKRRVREVFRTHLPEIAAPFDIVVVARQNAASADYDTLARDLLNSFRRLLLLK